MQSKLHISLKSLSEHSIDELYSILALRSHVFVVEQDCVYQDLDGKDQLAKHLSLWRNESCVGYCRLFSPGAYFKNSSIGRVVVHPDERGNALGHLLMKKAIDEIERCKWGTIEISAQKYLLSFYNSHGFTARGEEYLEDGLPHFRMFRK